MVQPNMEADKMLDVFIYDYFMKRKLSDSANAFLAEAEVPANSMTIDAPGGFLFEWWSVFWDIFIARYKRPGEGGAGSNSAAQSFADQVQQNQPDTQQQLERMQQLILQKQIQQEQKQKEQNDEARIRNTTGNARGRQNPRAAHGLAKRIHEDHSKSRKDHLAMANVRAHNHVSVSESVGIQDRPPMLREELCGIPAGNVLNSNPIKDRIHQLPVPQDLSIQMDPLLNIRAGQSDGPLFGVSGSNQEITNFPLKGWPLMGLDRLQAGLMQQQNSLITQQQFQMQQQLQMLFNPQKNVGIPKDMVSHSACSIVPSNSLQVQVGLPISSHGDDEVLAKLYQQLLQSDNQYQQYRSQLDLHSPYSENQSCLFQPNRMAGGSTLLDASAGNEQASSNRIMRKRKQPMPSSAPTNSSDTANTPAPPANSAPSTPSTHTTDAIAIPTLTFNGYSKVHTPGSGILCSRAPSQNQLSQGHLLDLMNTGSLDDNFELFSPASASGQSSNTNIDFTVSQIGRIQVMKFNCFDFSSNGKLIATGVPNKKVIFWCTRFKEQKSTVEEHSNEITDIRFGPRSSRLATSSLDKTVKIWDVDNLSSSLQTFIGHSAPVISVDFHPNKEDFICSCDDVSAIRYWSIKDGGCAGVVSKGGATQVKFQPINGRHLAAAVGAGVSIIDVETTQTCRYPIKGHTSKVKSVCWNPSGEYLASMSEDLVKVWKIGSGEKQECVYELSMRGKKIQCCIFHPCNPSLMIVGLGQSLELWHMAESKMATLLGDPTTGLAVSQSAGLVASASDDNSISIWK